MRVPDPGFLVYARLFGFPVEEKKMCKLALRSVLVGILLPFLLGLVGRAFGDPQSQDLNRLTTGEYTFRPMVDNGRILWYSSFGPTVSVVLYDGSATRTIVTDADVVFTGPPDLDEHGNVVYIKKEGDKHQVFLYDGTTHLQLSDNPDIPGSPSIGLGTDQRITGWPRVANKHVVFRDTGGNVFLYDPNRQTIRQINPSDAQAANVREGDHLSGIPDRKIFEFDGGTIVWFHEDVIRQGFESEMTIYVAKPPYDNPPEAITVFRAWTPGNFGPVKGLLMDPFFVACRDQVAWQYIPPTNLIPDFPGYRLSSDDTIINYYNGHSVSTIRGAGPVAVRSIRIHDGQVAWYEDASEPVNAEKVFLFNGTNISQVASFPDPRPDEPLGKRRWTDICSVDINLGQVAWLAQELECQEFFLPDVCYFLPTGRFGLFTGSSGPDPLAVLEAPLGAGSADFESGLYAFVGHVGPGISDVFSYQVIETPTETNATLRLDDTKPEPTLARFDEDKTVVADGFKLTVAGDCSVTLSEGVDITAMTFSGRALSGIDADMTDIENVRLYLDFDADGEFTDDLLLGEGTFVDANVTFSLVPSLVLPPGSEAHFVLVYDLVDSVCPCNRYESLLVAHDIEATTTESQTVPVRVGSSTGRIILPEPRFVMFSSKEMFGGDEQADFVKSKLPEKLGIRVENFPIKCGQARFEMSNQLGIGINNASLAGPDGNSPRVTLPFVQDGQDAVAEIEMTLGDKDGLYAVEAAIKFTEPAKCESPMHVFRERAGRIVLEVVDAGNPKFYDATKISGDQPTWEVTISDDYRNRLSKGGKTCVATTTDGCSMLLIRAKLVAFSEPPPGEVEFSLSGAGEVGSLTTSLGIVIPPSSGATTAQAEWKKTPHGVYAFALYTPPVNFGDRNAATRTVTLTVQYTLPSDPGNIQEATTDLTLYRPPILFVHGMWSDDSTWGPAYTRKDPRFQKELLDYSGGKPSGNARSFSEQGHVIGNEVYRIVNDRRSQDKPIATTKVVVVAHSMGGLLTRQFVADDNGLSYRREDNFGKGDIHKFITMGTPHWGSPLAWLTKSLRDNDPVINPIIDSALHDLLLKVVDKAGLDIYSGAIDAMCPGSAELKNLGESVVPTHTIEAWYLNTGQTDVSLWGSFSHILESTIDIRRGNLKPSPWGVLVSALGYMTDVSTAILYSFDKTDFLVTTTSQSGGNFTEAQTRVFDNTTHFALGTNLSPFIENETDSEEIAQHVFELIHAPVDGPFAESLPPPVVQDDDIQCAISSPPDQSQIRLFAQSEEPEGGIAIMYPIDRQAVHPGDRWTVTAQTLPNIALASVIFLSPAETIFVEQAPYQTEMEIPKTTVGTFPIVVVGKDFEGGLHVSSITLNVEQETTLESLDVEPARLFMKQRATVLLRVDGAYADGVLRNLTSSETGTFYQSWDEQIVAVDENGTVEARAEGETFILVSNGPVDQIVDVKVGR